MVHLIAITIDSVLNRISSQRDSSKTSSSHQSNPIECYRNQNAKDCDPLKPLLMERLSKDNKDFWIKFWSRSFWYIYIHMVALWSSFSIQRANGLMLRPMVLQCSLKVSGAPWDHIELYSSLFVVAILICDSEKNTRREHRDILESFAAYEVVQALSFYKLADVVFQQGRPGVCFYNW